jgi:hypothetical protein
MENINVERLVGEILKLDRKVEGLSTSWRDEFGQQVDTIRYIFDDLIKPQISGSLEVYEMGRTLHALDDFTLLDQADWKRLSKARKQAIDVMRATTEIVVRRLVNCVLENGNN